MWFGAVKGELCSCNCKVVVVTLQVWEGRKQGWKSRNFDGTTKNRSYEISVDENTTV